MPRLGHPRDRSQDLRDQPGPCSVQCPTPPSRAHLHAVRSGAVAGEPSFLDLRVPPLLANGPSPHIQVATPRGHAHSGVSPDKHRQHRGGRCGWSCTASGTAAARAACGVSCHGIRSRRREGLSVPHAWVCPSREISPPGLAGRTPVPSVSQSPLRSRPHGHTRPGLRRRRCRESLTPRPLVPHTRRSSQGRPLTISPRPNRPWPAPGPWLSPRKGPLPP